LETYTITREQLDNTYTDFAAKHHSGKKLTISDIQAEIVDFVGQLSHFCAKLPFLPSIFYIVQIRHIIFLIITRAALSSIGA